MGRRPRNEVLGLLHHVYCRGNRGGRVFNDDGDYAAFTEKLFTLASKTKVEVLAYCLMPNHFHLCVRTQEGGALLSQFMQRLNLWHTRQYNFKHGVRGRLNESRYKAKEVDGEHYLMVLVRYIHQNPVRAGIAADVDAWKYSSHAAYVGSSKHPVATSEILGLLGGRTGYQAFVAQAEKKTEDVDRIRFHRRPLPALPAPDAALGIPGAQGELLRRVCALRACGLSLSDIGEQLSCNKFRVRRLLETATRGEATTCSEAEAVYCRAA